MRITRIVHIQRYLDGKTTYIWHEAINNPWQERWIREYLNILREEYHKTKNYILKNVIIEDS